MIIKKFWKIKKKKKYFKKKIFIGMIFLKI